MSVSNRGTVPEFLIKNGSTEFINKQKNLFNILAVVEKEKRSTNDYDELMEIDENKSRKRKQRKETKQFRGKDSFFKEPVDLPLRFKKFNRIPDFQRNPHKWTKYSLGDISQDDMSNESNRAAAFSFLRSLKAQKTKPTIKVEKNEPEIKTPCSNLHQFTQPSKDSKLGCTKEIIDSASYFKKPMFKSSKLIMPEYVVGQVKKENKKLSAKLKVEKGKEIFLNHIHEYEDE